LVPESVLEQILEKTTEAGADGLRADLALHRASSALAAWHGREQATEEDVEAVAELALRHRRRRKEMQQQQPPPSRPPTPKPPAPNGTNGQQQPQKNISKKKRA
jgi:Mg-chelatase subunit ChlI